MIDMLISFVVQFFEKAGFYFVPILALFGFLNLKSLKPGKIKILYLAFTTAWLALYAAFGTGSSRYLLIPLLLWGLLAGAGLEFCWSQLCRIPFLRNISVNILILLVSAGVFLGAIGHIALRNTNDMIPVFTKELMKDIRNDSTIYCIDFKNASKLSGITDGLPHADLISFETWEKAIEHLILHQYENKTFYFCVEFPRPYTAEDFKSWFRSCYYVYPFDILQEYSYRKKNYLLLKFNRKTGIRGEAASEKFVFRPVPENVTFKKWKYDWKRLPVADILSDVSYSTGGFFTAVPMQQIAGYFYLRANVKSFQSPINITRYNDLCWPEENCSFTLTAPDTPAICTEIPASAVKKASVPSAEKPLVLIPPCVFIPETFPKLFLSGAVPVYRQDIHNILFANNQEMIPVTEKDPAIRLQVTEQGTGQSVSGDIPVKWLKKSDSSGIPFSVLLVDDKQYKKLFLSENLSALWKEKCHVDCIFKKDQAVTSLDVAEYLNWPKKKYSAIILNILLDPVARPWSFPFQTDPAADEMLTGFIREIHNRYPGTPCFIILPPAPTDRPSFYTLCYHSPQLSRLSHYRVCEAVQRWFIRMRPENVYLIPLYFCVDPNEDYTIHLIIDSVKTYSGYYFKPEVLRRFAEIIGLTVLNFVKE